MPNNAGERTTSHAPGISYKCASPARKPEDSLLTLYGSPTMPAFCPRVIFSSCISRHARLFPVRFPGDGVNVMKESTLWVESLGSIVCDDSTSCECQQGALNFTHKHESGHAYTQPDDSCSTGYLQHLCAAI